MHCGRVLPDRLAWCVDSWLKHSSFSAFDVLEHNFIISIEFLPDRLTYESCLTSSNQTELLYFLRDLGGEDERHDLTIVSVVLPIIDWLNAVLQETFLVHRWQERDFFAHLREFERLGHSLFFLEDFSFCVVILLHLKVLAALVLGILHWILELGSGFANLCLDFLQVVAVADTCDFLVHL